MFFVEAREKYLSGCSFHLELENIHKNGALYFIPIIKNDTDEIQNSLKLFTKGNTKNISNFILNFSNINTCNTALIGYPAGFQGSVQKCHLYILHVNCKYLITSKEFVAGILFLFSWSCWYSSIFCWQSLTLIIHHFDHILWQIWIMSYVAAS